MHGDEQTIEIDSSRAAGKSSEKKRKKKIFSRNSEEQISEEVEEEDHISFGMSKAQWEELIKSDKREAIRQFMLLSETFLDYDKEFDEKRPGTNGKYFTKTGFDAKKKALQTEKEIAAELLDSAGELSRNIPARVQNSSPVFSDGDSSSERDSSSEGDSITSTGEAETEAKKSKGKKRSLSSPNSLRERSNVGDRVRARVRLRIVAKGGEDRNEDEIDHAQILESVEEGRLQAEISFRTVDPTRDEILRNGSRNVNGHTTSDRSGTMWSGAGHAARTTRSTAASTATRRTAAMELVSSRGRRRQRGRAIYTPDHQLLPPW